MSSCAGLGPQLTRRVKRHNAVPLGFYDGYRHLMTNEASLRDLQQRCPAGVQMEQFRPNLVVFRRPAAWRKIAGKLASRGDVIFDVVKPCSRCILTISPERGKNILRTAGDTASFSYAAGTMAMWISVRI